MAHKKSQGTPKSAPDLNYSPNSNARRQPEQLPLDGVPEKVLNVGLPDFGTLDAYVLDLMLTGKRFNQFDVPDTYRRVGAVIERLNNDYNWKGFIQVCKFKHEHTG